MAKDDGGHQRLLHDSEANLARRVEYERRRRGWSQERLATQMVRAGVPVHQSAISKIERTTDRRAITVDEALAFARVFDLPVVEMLKPVEAAMSEEVARLFAELGEAMELSRLAGLKVSDAMARLGELLEQNPGADAALTSLIQRRLADRGLDPDHWIDDLPDAFRQSFREHRGEQ